MLCFLKGSGAQFALETTLPRPKKAPRGAKSQAVRDYLKANKDAGPSAVVAALKAQRLTVSIAMVSQIKAKMGLSRKRRRRQSARATSSANLAGTISVNDLVRAKKLVDEIGAERARDAIDTLTQLL